MCGISGCTIAQAQSQLSHAEFMSWVKYRQLRGSLNQGLRTDRGFALLATLYANANSKNGGYTIYDFMPHEDEPVLTLEEAMGSWA